MGPDTAIAEPATDLIVQQPAVPPADLRGSILMINILYAAAPFSGGLTSLAGVVLAYMRRQDVRGTVWESHVAYAIRTFWLWLLLLLAGLVLTVVGVGFVVLALAFIWYVVRVVRGFLAWSESQPIGDPRRLL